MKLALRSNWQATECGVANFGRDWQAALEAAGHFVTPLFWIDPVPNDIEFMLCNWHPSTCSPSVPPSPVPYAVFLHDLPRWSLCEQSEAVIYYTSEPYTGHEYKETLEIGYPVWDFTLKLPPVPEQVTIGWTGLRGDGRDNIRDLCVARGWAFNGPTTNWRYTPQEIQRLAASTIVVLWYHASGRGQSLALSTACATKRPVLVNGSQMFRLADARHEEIYRAGINPAVPLLEQAIDGVLDDVFKGKAKRPRAVISDYGWTKAIAKMEATWRR